MSVNSKMTAIADAIRAKTGGTGLLTLDDMAQDIAAIDTSENLDEVLDEQDSIIDQIQAALEGKAGANGLSVETCTVVIQQSGGANLVAFGATCFDGEVFYAEHDYKFPAPFIALPHTIENVVCETTLCVSIGAVMPTANISGGEELYEYNGGACFQITANPGETATITIVEND